ncbi:hypothetical protein [Streptomyces sp. NPDC047718]|uniref:hypothetical protein n=1 Tax=Streptomyces sp. NPDC047718 TaxID=3155479 RepID=UPI0033E9227F
MKHSTSLDPLAERTVIAVCALAVAVGPNGGGPALSRTRPRRWMCSPEAVVPTAVAALREGVEHVPAAVPSSGRMNRA